MILSEKNILKKLNRLTSESTDHTWKLAEEFISKAE